MIVVFSAAVAVTATSVFVAVIVTAVTVVAIAVINAVAVAVVTAVVLAATGVNPLPLPLLPLPQLSLLHFPLQLLVDCCLALSAESIILSVGGAEMCNILSVYHTKSSCLVVMH